MDPELWFPGSEKPQDRLSRGRLRRAKAICHGCPVREECLIYAVRTGQRFGVWGGMTSRERVDSPYCQRIRQAAGVA